MNVEDARALEIGDTVHYRPGTRAMRTGKVTHVNDDGSVSLTFEHDQTGEMAGNVDPADIESVDVPAVPGVAEWESE
jgi:hypothetical protein